MLAKGPLLTGLDAVVKRQELEARQGLEFIQNVDLWLLIATIIILLGEGFLIFRPLSNQVMRSANEVLKSNEDLQHSLRHDQLTGLPNPSLHARIPRHVAVPGQSLRPSGWPVSD